VWSLLLAPLYYLVVTPAGAVSRLVRDPLRRRWSRPSTNYLKYKAK
jgi:hypothetical protein